MAADADRSPLEGADGFEWDDNKRRVNIVKHGIDFDDAKDVFGDPHSLVAPSNAGNEPRYLIVGLVRRLIAAVIFTRRGTKIRIISARPARRNERDRYATQSSDEKE